MAACFLGVFVQAETLVFGVREWRVASYYDEQGVSALPHTRHEVSGVARAGLPPCGLISSRAISSLSSDLKADNPAPRLPALEGSPLAVVEASVLEPSLTELPLTQLPSADSSAELGSADRESVIGPEALITGIMPALLSEVFKPLSLCYQSYPPRRLLYSALRGQVAMLTLPWVEGLEKPVVLPDGLIVGREPLFRFDLNFYALTSSGIELQSAEEILPYRVGVVRHSAFLDQLLLRNSHTEIKLTRFSMADQMLKALLAQRVDLVLLAEPVMHALGQQLGAVSAVEPVWRVGDSGGRHLAFSSAALGERSTQLRDATDQRLRQLRANGWLAELIRRQAPQGWIRE